MNLSLVGKNALVCGSSKGIGKAAAIELSKLGANIILVSRSA
jgi:3-oxoacyl-[acyl-carrier protein] reductase